MGWVNWAIVGAALLHVAEEYYIPGGFMDFMRRFNPRFALHITTSFAVIFNGLFILLCILGAAFREMSPVFSLSVAGLLGFNALMHIGAAIRMRGYAPGLISSLLLYLPISITSYTISIGSGVVTTPQAVSSFLLGGIYNALPIASLALLSRHKTSM